MKTNDAQRSEHLIEELEKQIIHASAKHRSLVATLLKRPVGHVIENPFALCYQTAQELMELAEKLPAERSLLSLTAPLGGNEFAHYTLCRAAFFHLIVAFEGLLNLIYDVYMKPELRDGRIVDRLAREQIDVKLRLAPLYCDCFTGKTLDHTTEAFREFSRLINARNDFIHGNLTKDMKTPLLSYDGMTFVLNSDDRSDSVLSSSIGDITIKDVMRVKEILDAIVAQILDNMKPRDRRIFKSVMLERFIRVEYDNEIAVITA